MERMEGNFSSNLLFNMQPLLIKTLSGPVVLNQQYIQQNEPQTTLEKQYTGR